MLPESKQTCLRKPFYLKVDSFIYMFIFEKSNVVCLEALSLVQVFLHIFTLYCGLYRVGKVLCTAHTTAQAACFRHVREEYFIDTYLISKVHSLVYEWCSHKLVIQAVCWEQLCNKHSQIYKILT